MSEQTQSQVGSIGWHDLAVPNAEAVRDFYQSVIGWQSQPLSMGDYDDYVMMPPGQEDGVAGVCHARGDNAEIPPVWLIYFIVEDVAASAAKCVELGGKMVIQVRPIGDKAFCIIQDPAGAICALYQA